MSWIIGDGFDYYGNNTDVSRSVWDLVNGSLQTTTRFNLGQSWALGFSQTQALYKVIPTNESTIYVNFAHWRQGALSGSATDFYIAYRDAGTVQCSVVFQQDGTIVFRRGIDTGTVLATFNAAFVAQLWAHFQIRVVIDPAAGSISIRKNGQTTDTWSATGLNTRSTANSYANQMAFATGNANSFFDDVLIFSGSGAAPNTWVGDVRAICLMPVADTGQKQFAVNTPSTVVMQPGTSGSNTCNPNIVYFYGGTTGASPSRAGTVTKVSYFINGAVTGHFRVAIYDATGALGAPGALLGQSAELTALTASSYNDFIFSPGVPISALRLYYIALIADVSLSVTGTGFANQYTLARTYASGFPNPATGAAISNFIQPAPVLTVSGNSWAVSEALANGDTDYVFDATVNDEDLYAMDDLPVTPIAIIGVQSRIYVKKSDAGTRQAQLRISSAGTEVGGVDTVLGTTYVYLNRIDTVDPATGLAWTLAGVNAVLVGQKVTL